MQHSKPVRGCRILPLIALIG